MTWLFTIRKLQVRGRIASAHRALIRCGQPGRSVYSDIGSKRLIFVLDNYDSFTYNLVQYLGELGAEVEVRRNDQVTVEEVEAMEPEKIVVSPGPCTPHEAGISIDLIRSLQEGARPRSVPGPSGHRRSLRRQGDSRATPYAWQDQPDHAR